MVEGDHLAVDADSVTVSNAYEGFDLSSSRLVLRHAAMQRYYTAAYLYCGYANVAGSAFAGGNAEYGIQLYGCGAADSLVVDSSSFQGHNDDALYAGSSSAAMLVSYSTFTDNGTAISQSCGQLRVSQVTVDGGDQGVSGSGCSSLDTLLVDQSSFSQLGGGVTLSPNAGIGMVTNSVFTDNGLGAYVYQGRAQVSGNQFVVPDYGTGAELYWYSSPIGSSQVLSNTVSCAVPTNGTGIFVSHSSPAGTDSVAIEGNGMSGCPTGVFSQGGSRVTLRNNVVTLPALQSGNGIYVDADSAALVVGNSVTGGASNGSIQIETARSVTLDSNVVTNPAGAALNVSGTIDTLRVRDNTVTGLSPSTYFAPSAAIALSGGGAASNAIAEVRRNRITGTTNGIVLTAGSGDTVTVRVDSNTVRHADSIGVWVQGYQKAILRYNALDSMGLDGVRISNTYLAGPQAVVNTNNLTRSAQFGVRNLSGYVIDATDNWWGDASGPACDTTCGSGDSVSTNVAFAPARPTPVSTYAPAPRMVAATGLRLSPVVRAAVPSQGVRRAWRAPAAAPSRPGATWTPAPTRVVAEPPALERSSRWAQGLAAAARAEAARLRQRQAEQARLSQQQDALRQARDQRRAAQEQAREAQRREAPPAPPRRPQ
jgi:hypothetical protein